MAANLELQGTVGARQSFSDDSSSSSSSDSEDDGQVEQCRLGKRLAREALDMTDLT